jgi:hypothetical protein
MSRIIIVTLAIVFGLVSPIHAGEDARLVEQSGGSDSGVEYAGSLQLFSAYKFRGTKIWTAPTLLPAGEIGTAVGPGTLSAGIRAALPLADRTSLAPVRDEVQLTGAYGIDATDRLSLDLGAIVYVVPGAGQPQSEELFVEPSLYLGAGFDVVAGAYADFRTREGAYYRVQPGWHGGLGGGFGAGAAAFAGGGGYAGEDFRLTEAGGKASLDYDLGNGLHVDLGGKTNYNHADGKVGTLFFTGVGFSG